MLRCKKKRKDYEKDYTKIVEKILYIVLYWSYGTTCGKDVRRI